MYCPSCGTQTSNDTKYCRVCGTNLHAVTELLTGQGVTANTEGSAVAGTVQPDDRRKFMRLGFVVLFGGIIFATLLAAIGDSVRPMYRNLGNAIENFGSVGAIIMLLGIGLMIYSRFFPRVTTAIQQAKRELLPPPSLVHDTAAIPKPEALPSVTEHTTFQLKPPIKEDQRR
jgi:RNA polymerase subunit RPABC4/transcription elongation factor Spt4